VRVLADLKGGVDAMLESRGVRARMHARAHFGVVIAGEFGPDGARHFDVVGKAVQAVSLLDRSGITLSLAAMRKLGAESRTRFSRHSAPLGAGGILPGIGIGLFGFLAFFLGGTLLTDRLPNPPAAFEAAGVASPIAPETAGAAPDPAGSGTGDAPPDLSGATQPPVSGPSAFTVQVGAFAEPANAEGLQSALAARGHEAYRVELDRGGAPLTMVRVGGFASRAEASDAAADLSDDGLPTFVVRSGAR
jgi:hypothetical protein